MERQNSLDKNITEFKSYEFIFMFNKVTASPRVVYFMIDPWSGTKLFPKTNVVKFPKLANLVGYKPVVLEDCLYIIGGKDWETGEYKATTWRYDPANSKWIVRASLNDARCRHTADVLNGCIYITGGEVHGGTVTESCECYDPSTDKWTTVAPLPRPRADHASCVNAGSLYVSGGISNLKHQCSDVFWSFDPLTNAWQEPIDGVQLPHEREKHNMMSVGKRVYILGGRGFDSETFSEKDECAISCFNTKLKDDKELCWDSTHPNMINPRANAGTILLGQNIYIIGGKSYQKDKDVLAVECYNTKRRKIRESFTLPDTNSYVSVDCVQLKVPTSNKDLNFNDILLYDKWIMW